MRMAVIKDGTVIMVIIADAGFDLGDGTLCVPGPDADIGDKYDNGVFVKSTGGEQ